MYPNEAGHATIWLDYKDKTHRYYAYPRLMKYDENGYETLEPQFEDVTLRKAWGKNLAPSGTTTILGNTLEKNGLLTWAMGMALQELFGFYKFEGDDGTKRHGFSYDEVVDPKTGKITKLDTLKGTMWEYVDGEPVTKRLTPEELLPIVTSANSNHTRRKQKGADIGTVVHDAIEHYLKKQPFDIGEQYLWSIKDSQYESEVDRTRALEEFENDVRQANLAFESFVNWWDETEPELYGAEELLYSKKHNVAGTYDGNIGIKAQYHPKFSDLGQQIIRVTADWKTSKASLSQFANMPQGAGYVYFIQSAIYEIIRRELGEPPADDLLIVSVRKDGGFDLIYASAVGLTIADCIEWALGVLAANRLMKKTIKGLWENFYNDHPEKRPVPKERKKAAKKKV